MKIFSYRYLPLNLYVVYSLFVVLSLLIGPVKYKNINYDVIISFVALLVFLFAIGYLLGVKGRQLNPYLNISDNTCNFSFKIKWLLIFLITYGVVSSISHWYFMVSSNSNFNLHSIGSNYVNNYEGYVRGQASISVTYVLRIFDQALLMLILLFGMCYYKDMGRSARAAVLFIVISYLLVNVIGAGKQKFLGDVVIFLAFASIIYTASKKIKLRFTGVCLLFGSIFTIFYFFIEILRQRYMAAGIGLDNIYEKAHPLVFWDESSSVFDLFGNEYGFALGVFLFYFTNGLYGLYLSLILPFEWSYFVGNSYSLGRIVEIVLGEKGLILEKTYPYRVGEEYGWGFDKWHSLFAWLASDITFIGVLILTPFFAYFYGKLWMEAINSRNAFSGPLFIYLSLGLIFSFANNQIMHGLAGVIVLFVLMLGWFLKVPSFKY